MAVGLLFVSIKFNQFLITILKQFIPNPLKKIKYHEKRAFNSSFSSCIIISWL